MVALVPPFLAFASSKMAQAAPDKSKVTTSKVHTKLSLQAGPMLSAAGRQAIEAIAAPLFGSVIKGEYAQGLARLQKVYALDKAQRSYLADRMLQLEQRLGRAQKYERLSRRFLPGSTTVLRVYYMTLHPLKPALWALDFYRSPGQAERQIGQKGALTAGGQQAKWILTSLRIETEAPFALVEGSQTWHKSY